MKRVSLIRAYIVYDAEDNYSTSDIEVGTWDCRNYFVESTALDETKNKGEVGNDLTLAHTDILAGDTVTFYSANNSGRPGQGHLVIEWVYVK